ncbi:proline-rich proteoglycan 2-like isoform X3 [Oryctolagus cuniculus]|uniref:proline-rich proteoglycan 2-like isoform X3 n=1 Tax=Oryctolagus cuniculus TaxID=9986 RepID=UPI003879E4E4
MLEPDAGSSLLWPRITVEGGPSPWAPAPAWETWKKLPAPGFGLTQLRPLRPSEYENLDESLAATQNDDDSQEDRPQHRPPHPGGHHNQTRPPPHGNHQRPPPPQKGTKPPPPEKDEGLKNSN